MAPSSRGDSVVRDEWKAAPSCRADFVRRDGFTMAVIWLPLVLVSVRRDGWMVLSSVLDAIVLVFLWPAGLSCAPPSWSKEVSKKCFQTCGFATWSIKRVS